jgi:hypothetical protein
MRNLNEKVLQHGLGGPSIKAILQNGQGSQNPNGNLANSLKDKVQAEGITSSQECKAKAATDKKTGALQDEKQKQRKGDIRVSYYLSSGLKMR